MKLEVVVEIPGGSRNKYEADHETGEIWLDRTLFTSTVFPLDYGYVPSTLGVDGDPLDALILLEQPTFPGCHIRCRPIGVLWIKSKKDDEAKLLCIPCRDPRGDWNSLTDVPDHLREAISHFFDVYKDLGPGSTKEVGRWGERREAELEVKRAMQRYEKRVRAA